MPETIAAYAHCPAHHAGYVAPTGAPAGWSSYQNNWGFKGSHAEPGTGPLAAMHGGVMPGPEEAPPGICMGISAPPIAAPRRVSSALDNLTRRFKAAAEKGASLALVQPRQVTAPRNCAVATSSRT